MARGPAARCTKCSYVAVHALCCVVVAVEARSFLVRMAGGGGAPAASANGLEVPEVGKIICCDADGAHMGVVVPGYRYGGVRLAW